VERAVFAGGGAYEDILLNVLRRQLTVEIEVAQPLRGFDLSSGRTNLNFDSDRRGFLCEWAVVVGLGLKSWDGAKRGRRQEEYETQNTR
jgi:Tfp pilus assembly PilM family ATPase